MSDKSLGHSICDAFEFLHTVFRDLESLSVSLTQQMAENEWEAWNPLRIAPGTYQHEYFAIFAPSAPKEEREFQVAIMLYLRLGAKEFIAEPLLLGVVADFGSRVNNRDVWNGWRREGCMRVARHLLQNNSKSALASQLLAPDFAPAAKRGAGIVMPLCSLGSASDVHLRVIEPLFGYVREFGYATYNAK